MIPFNLDKKLNTPKLAASTQHYLNGRRLCQVCEAHPRGRVIEVHEEVVIVNVDSQLERLCVLVVSEEMVKEFPGQIVNVL